MLSVATVLAGPYSDVCLSFSSNCMNIIANIKLILYVIGPVHQGTAESTGTKTENNAGSSDEQASNDGSSDDSASDDDDSGSDDSDSGSDGDDSGSD